MPLDQLRHLRVLWLARPGTENVIVRTVRGGCFAAGRSHAELFLAVALRRIGRCADEDVVGAMLKMRR